MDADRGVDAVAAIEKVAPDSHGTGTISSLQAAVMLIVIAAVLAGYVALCKIIGNAELYAGFLFLTCWMLIEHGKLIRLAYAACGFAFGLALSYLLHLLVSGPFGPTTGGLVFCAALVPIVYLQILGRLSVILNASAMVALTALTIPYVQEHGNFAHAAIALVLACIYFGLIVAIGQHAVRLWTRKDQR
jgi:hypothetical protein